RLHASNERAAVGPELADLTHNLFAVPGDAFAVHVAREDCESVLGEASCAPARVVIDPGATVHHENPRPFAHTVGIDCKKPVESRVAVAVDDLLGFKSHSQ